jgi:hypothetical protein
VALAWLHRWSALAPPLVSTTGLSLWLHRWSALAMQREHRTHRWPVAPADRRRSLRGSMSPLRRSRRGLGARPDRLRVGCWPRIGLRGRTGLEGLDALLFPLHALLSPLHAPLSPLHALLCSSKSLPSQREHRNLCKRHESPVNQAHKEDASLIPSMHGARIASSMPGTLVTTRQECSTVLPYTGKSTVLPYKGHAARVSAPAYTRMPPCWRAPDARRGVCREVRMHDASRACTARPEHG